MSVAPAPAPVGMLTYAALSEAGQSEIYTIWTDGSHRDQLTGNGGHNPVWSPDGTQIAYERSGTIRLMDPLGGSQRLLADGSGPAWSPDGQILSYECGAAGQLCTLDLASGEEAVIVPADPDWVGVGAMDWSPDGSSIVFTRYSADGDDYSLYRQLFLVGPDGNDLAAIDETFSEADMPSWSPDGTSILYTRRYDGRGGEGSGDLYTIRPDGTEHTRVTSTVGHDHDATWAPDGRWLAMESEGQHYPSKSGIWLMTIDDRQRDLVVRNGSNPDWRPGFSRNPAPPAGPGTRPGPRIAYVAHTAAGFDLFTVRPTGTGRRRLTATGDVHNPAWSPDHTRIAFFRGSPSSGGVVWIANTLTGAIRRAAQASNARGGLGWSPDGRRLAWGNFGGLTIFNLRTHDRRSLPLRRGCCAHDPSWAPGGNQIAFSRESGIGFADVMVIGAGGKNLHRVTSMRRAEAHSDWSPDGQLILFTHSFGPWWNGEQALRTVRPDGRRNRFLIGTEQSYSPAWSPSGRRIAYYTEGPRPARTAGLWTAGPRGHLRDAVVRDQTIAYVDW